MSEDLDICDLSKAGLYQERHTCYKLVKVINLMLHEVIIPTNVNS